MLINKNKKITAIVYLLISILLCAALVIGGFSISKAFAEGSSIGAPGEFGTSGSSVEITMTGEKKHVFQNYQYGCAYYEKDGENLSNTILIGGRNFPDSVTASNDTALSKAEVVNKATEIVDITEQVGKYHDSGAQTNVEKRIAENDSSKTYADIQQIFKQAYSRADGNINGINMGIPVTGLKEWDNNVCQEFATGDSTYRYGNLDRSGYGLLFYSFVDDNVYYMTDGFAEKFTSEADIRRSTGNLLNNSNDVVSVDAANRVIQYSDSAYYENESGTVSFTSGYTYNKATQKLEGVRTFLSSFGIKKGSEITIGSYTYQNLAYGYAKWNTNDFGTINYRANFSIDSSQNISALNHAVLTGEISSRGVETSGSENVYQVLPEAVTNASLISMFQEVMKAAVDEGWSVGIASSKIKLWGGNVIMDFVFGDGGFAFGSGRENMSFIVYNHIENSAYLVGEFSSVWAPDDGAKLKIGLPVSGTFYNITVNKTGQNVNYRKIQFFDSGIIYTDNSGQVKVEGGYSYSFEGGAHKLTQAPAPTKPEGYQSLIEIKTNDNIYYYNYQYGCIKAEMVSGEFRYTYYNCRYFDFEDGYKVKAYAVDDLVDWDNLVFSNNPTKKPNTEVSAMCKAVYTDFYNAGFIIGVLDGEVREWNGAYTMQFYLGDSTGKPFEERRKDFSVLMFSSDYSAVYLVTNRATVIFNEDGGLIGTPIENMTYIEEIDVSIQRFSSGSYIVETGSTSYTVKSSVSYETFVRDYKEFYQNFKPSHEGDSEKGYVGIGNVVGSNELGIANNEEDKGCGSVIGYSAIGYSAVLIFAAAVLLFAKRSAKRKEKN